MGGVKGSLFSKGISQKVNVKILLEFELTYYNAATQHVCHIYEDESVSPYPDKSYCSEIFTE